MAIIGLPPQTKHKMKDVVPLDTPYTVVISPMDFCNINCIFCPYHGESGKHLPEKKVMDFDLYKKLIDDLTVFPHRVSRLSFTGFGEPTLHKDLPKMIRYAHDKNVAKEIMLVTNGLLLEHEYNMELISAGLDYIRISVAAIDNETAFKITGHHIDVEEKYVSNIKDLFESKNTMIVLCKTTNYALGGMGGKEPTKKLVDRFYSIYDRCCDYMCVENIAPWAGIDDPSLKKQGLESLPKKNMNGRSTSLRHFCEFWFYAITIDTNGDIRPCCVVDAPIIGNLNENRLLNIWNSNRYHNLRIAHINEKIDICCSCGVNSFINIQNIDEDIKIIRDKLTFARMEKTE